MKKITAVIVAIAALCAFTSMKAEEAKEAKKDGKAIFTASKCVMCHSVESAGIKKAPKKTDLSAVEMKTEKIETYLMKESDLNGKKHAVKFNGSKEDLAVVAKWLASQKPAK
ncbi:MAG TPA: c-type cytochrome [Bacteroidota bacterium]|nr:c-type cytochrome [Bacteroidota bacterium]